MSSIVNNGWGRELCVHGIDLRGVKWQNDLRKLNSPMQTWLRTVRTVWKWHYIVIISYVWKIKYNCLFVHQNVLNYDFFCIRIQIPVVKWLGVMKYRLLVGMGYNQNAFFGIRVVLFLIWINHNISWMKKTSRRYLNSEPTCLFLQSLVRQLGYLARDFERFSNVLLLNTII